MIRTVGLVLLGVLVGPAQAGETYTIKIKEDVKGTKSLVEKKDAERGKITVTDNGGKELQGKETNKKATYVYRETILEKPAGAPATRLKRAYEKAQVTEGGKTTALPYEGKTVLIEKADGKYTFQIEGGAELTGADAALLQKEFKAKADDPTDWQKTLLPGRPVQLNEVWKIKIEPLLKTVAKQGFDLDADKSSATGKLVRVHKEDGALFGVLEFRLEFAPRAMQQGKQRIALEPGAKLTMALTVDACIDGTVGTATMTAKRGGRLRALLPSPDNPQARMDIDIQGDSHVRGKELAGE